MIDWQEQYDAPAFQSWHSYNPCDNALPPLAPIDHEASSLDNLTAFNNDDTIVDNPLASHPDPTPDPVSAGSKSNSSPKDISSNPGSNSPSSCRIEKRKANTLAARRYRQKRLDRVAELESALEATRLERDTLKVQVAKLQGETQVLRALVCGEPGGRRG